MGKFLGRRGRQTTRIHRYLLTNAALEGGKSHPENSGLCFLNQPVHPDHTDFSQKDCHPTNICKSQRRRFSVLAIDCLSLPIPFLARYVPDFQGREANNCRISCSSVRISCSKVWVTSRGISCTVIVTGRMAKTS